MGPQPIFDVIEEGLLITSQQKSGVLVTKLKGNIRNMVWKLKKDLVS